MPSTTLRGAVLGVTRVSLIFLHAVSGLHDNTLLGEPE